MRYFVLAQAVVPIIPKKFGLVQEIEGLKNITFTLNQEIKYGNELSKFMLVEEIEQPVTTTIYKRVRI